MMFEVLMTVFFGTKILYCIVLRMVFNIFIGITCISVAVAQPNPTLRTIYTFEIRS